MTVALTPVESSNIEAIGHDPEKNDLHVRFKGSGTYVYHGVSSDQHGQLMAAKSKGTHFRSAIMGKHKVTKQ